MSGACNTNCIATHIPPEKWEMNNLEVNEKFDVYSFSMVLWELLSNEKPFENCKPCD